MQRHQSCQAEFGAFFHNHIHFWTLGQCLPKDEWFGGEHRRSQQRQSLSLHMRRCHAGQAEQALLTGTIEGDNFIPNP
jgi:hypothetical protein